MVEMGSSGLFGGGEGAVRPSAKGGTTALAHCDGGARGNPGPAGYGAVITDEAGAITLQVIGPDVTGGQNPQALVPAGSWQAAEAAGGWALVSCVVSPAFQFSGFELAPPGWWPSAASPLPAGPSAP